MIDVCTYVTLRDVMIFLGAHYWNLIAGRLQIRSSVQLNLMFTTRYFSRP